MFDQDEYTSSYTVDYLTGENTAPVPGVLAAYAPAMLLPSWCLPVRGTEVLGRSNATFPLDERSISRRHAQIVNEMIYCTVEDLGSKNGTFIDERRVTERCPIQDGALLRIGKVLLVYHDNIAPLMYKDKDRLFGMAGRFHTKKLVSDLSACVHLKKRGILLVGPTGTGKELAAGAAAAMLDRKIHIQNAARYTSEEEAMASLFGVKQGVFSSVDERKGYIEASDGGVLFLDEVHALTQRLQRSLLRIVEDNTLARIGETEGRKVDMKFVFATNRPGPDYGLEPDLLARLSVVHLKPLKERIADIPDIFISMLRLSLRNADCPLEPTVSLIDTTHHLALMMDGLEKENVRGLIAITDAIASMIARGAMPETAVDTAFADLIRQIPERAEQKSEKQELLTRTPEEQLITELYFAAGGNVSAMHKMMKEQHYVISRRRLGELVDQLGLARVKKPRRG